MNYEMIEQNFIERTIEILDQYAEFVQGKVKDKEEYEVTLLLNCLLGMLAYPHQLMSLTLDEPEQPSPRWTQSQRCTWLTDKSIETVGEDWGLKADFVKCSGYYNDDKRPVEDTGHLTIRNLIRQMRNCAAHASFKAHEGGTKSNKLQVVEFRERNKNKTSEREHGFHIVIPVDHLDKFVRKFARSAVELLSTDT